MGLSQFRLQGNGSLEADERLLAPPEPVQRHAEEIMGTRLSRIDAKTLRTISTPSLSRPCRQDALASSNNASALSAR
jgi:hypothetical protein